MNVHYNTFVISRNEKVKERERERERERGGGGGGEGRGNTSGNISISNGPDTFPEWTPNLMFMPPSLYSFASSHFPNLCACTGFTE